MKQWNKVWRCVGVWCLLVSLSGCSTAVDVATGATSMAVSAVGTVVSAVV